MVNTRSIAIMALVVVLLSIATGTIVYFTYNGTDDAPAGVVKPVIGTEFHFVLTSTLSGTSSEASIYADVWSGSNDVNGRIRYDEVYPPTSPDEDGFISTNIFRFDESPPAHYEIRTMPGDNIYCTKKDLTQSEATHIASNTNTAIMFDQCVGEDCYWFVWDGESDWTQNQVSNQKYKTDKSTGTLKAMNVDVCTAGSKAACDAALANWMVCQTGVGTLTGGCSCASWPPADEVNWCGIMMHWFDVSDYTGSAFNYANTPLFNTPVDTSGSLCVAYEAACDRNSASFDPAKTDCIPYKSPLNAIVISETADVNTAAAGFKKVFATPISKGAVAPQHIHERLQADEAERMRSLVFDPNGNSQVQLQSGACNLIFFSSALRNACNSYMASGGKYGNWCGKGGATGVCPGTNCNDGGFDACCNDHDHAKGGVTKKSEDVVGLLTILECGVDKQFKNCRTKSSACSLADNCLGNHVGCTAASNCINSRNAANTLFNVLPCSSWKWKDPWWRSGYWSSSWHWKWGNY